MPHVKSMVVHTTAVTTMLKSTAGTWCPLKRFAKSQMVTAA